MSVTSFVARKEVKERFRQVVNMPAVPDSSVLVASSLTPPQARLTGTAFDYLMRYTVARLYQPPQSADERFVAEGALQHLDAKLAKQKKKFIEEVHEELWMYSYGGKLSRALCEQCIRLARLDGVYRSRGMGIDVLDVFDPIVVDELEALVAVVDLKLFKGFDFAYLNPTFGIASHLIGGADADFVLDDMVVDVKTTQNLKPKPEDIFQQICYVLLCNLGGLGCTGTKWPPLRRIGFYRSRYGRFMSWPVEDLVDAKQFPPFVKWFEESISQY